MRSLSRLPYVASASIFLLLSAAAISPRLEAQARRIQALSADDPALVPLTATVPPHARAALDLGPLPSNQQLDSVTLRFSLTPAQNVALDQLLADQANPASPRYRQWLTPEQYAAQFGLSPADLANVTAWLTSKGLAITGVARSHSFVTFSGSAAQIQQAFETTLHAMSFDGESHFSNLSEPVLPAPLANVVSGMTGLNDFRLKPHVRPRQVPAPRPEFTSSVSGSHFIAPGDFYTIYDVSPLLSSSTNGAGVTIAVVGQTDLSQADVSAFRSASGLAQNPPVSRLFGADPGISSVDVDEAQLDVEWAGAVAPAAQILYVNSTDVIAGSLTQAIDNNLAPIITISYGNCEVGFGASNITTFNQLFRQANAQGQTIVGPSGDSGATDCDFNTFPASGGLAVDFPASSPNVTGVGGTAFNDASGSFFATNNNANAGSALSYIPESAWNDSFNGAGLASTGGGVSAFFAKPAYQTGAGVPSDFSRDVPDISFHAARDNDPFLFCSKGFCTDGFRNAGGFLDTVGGTSVSTPSFAGILALLEQRIQARVGNANPILYGLANSSFSSNVFHDVLSGNNNSPCQAGSPNCPSSGVVGFNAGPGYDLVSGLGSVDAFNLVSDWALATPAGLSRTIGTNTSSTVATTSAASIRAGAPLTLAVRVSSASNNVGAVATGTVQLLIDNAPVGTAVAITNGTATLDVPTATLTSGPHTLSASYSGDTTYAGSKGSASVDVISATTADFSLTPTASTVTVRTGGVAPALTFTVTSLNGFSGPVTFTASPGQSVVSATDSFSPVTVTLAASASATTVLTLSAFSSNAQTGTGQDKPNANSAQTSESHDLSRAWRLAGSGLTTAGILLLFVPRKRRRWSGLLLGILSIGVLSVAGCGSGSGISGSSVRPPVTTNAAPGTYSITVAATGSSGGATITHNATVTFVVQ